MNSLSKTIQQFEIQSQSVYFACILCMQCVLCLFNSYLNVDHLSLILLIVTLVWFWVFRRIILLKYFYLILITVWNILAVFVLENWEVYVPNLRIYSFHTGSLPILVFGFLCFLMALNYFDSRHGRTNLDEKKKKLSHSEKRVLEVGNTCLYIIVIVAVVFGALFGYYATGATSRYDFNESSESLVINAAYYLQYLIPIVSIFALYKNSSKILWCFAGLFLLYLVLVGNRFGALILTLYFCIISYYLPRNDENRSSEKATKQGMIILIFFAVVLALYSIVQFTYEKGNLSEALVQFFDRIFTGQGDVWWGIYANYADTGPHFDEIADELQGLMPLPVSQLQYDFAIYKMMNLIVPLNVLEVYSNLSVRLTTSTDASLLYYFGPAGVVLGKVVMAWCFSKIVNGIGKACINAKPIDAVVLTFLLGYLIRVYSMSEFYLIAALPTCVCYLTLLILYCIRNAKHMKKSITSQYVRGIYVIRERN